MSATAMALLKTVLAALLRLVYRVEVRGLEHYAAVTGPAVIVVNHVSFLDGVLLAAFLPGRPIFAIDTFVAQRWWARPATWLVDVLTLDPTNPFALRDAVRAVAGGGRCVIFPEGRITVTGALMKIYEGPGLIADRAHAPIVPVRIDGAQYTPFSRLRGKVRRRWFPRITLTVMPARDLRVPEHVVGRARRRAVGQALLAEMTQLVFATSDLHQTLFEALLDARDVHGRRHVIVNDIERKPMTMDRLIAASFALGARLAERTRTGERVGVLLPNSRALAATFFALHAYGRVPAILNFSTGRKGMEAAVIGAELRTILTSRRFVELAKLTDAVAALGTRATVVYLEDLAIGTLARLGGLLKARFARLAYRRNVRSRPDDPAVVLFTSGTEGTPKGVVLSHANILANRYQVAAVVDFNPADVVFNALPMFHSFGLTGGFLLPVLSGVRTFLYPSPLHYRIVPELVYDSDATIFFGTDTFLWGYARVANPYDFYSVRYVFAGAEKVREETRRAWMDKFGLRILEGYGATETAPVIATNTAMMYRAGTVGRVLPGLAYRIAPVEGIGRGGRLQVKGPNVMLGYLRAEKPGVLEPPQDGWYDTGDVVDIDADGYVTILGRAKRFAKVGGEMVPLGAVEEFVAKLWPERAHAVVTLPDERKGEALVLVTEQPDADRAALIAAARQQGMPELYVPRTVVKVQKLPLLGTGKADYLAAKKIAEEAKTEMA
jgi:acyl-[acyl-carrier-protein]-phospholipid O-acyltransferase/long-chain-fatty-acid--[acyl-carrier-protein] ligase